ncbi:Uncharacterized protein ALO91_05307 [Pseudomonas syringae pv. aceris]|uniref:Uncharacterized protein n=1 Tax=Pseudomonas syringae pv. aceris TaxID=199198 RepID=A0A0P9M076_PSESX|nr:Uncharacterized protein ALO91_05307 [Pseudomonas syringae pv. aceris]
MQLARAMGFVQLAEKQGLAVVGPGHAAVAVFKGQAADLTGAQLLDVKLIYLVATGVQAVGQTLVVRADAERTQREKAAIGHLVGVEQQFLGAFIHRVAVVGRARAAVVPGVFIALCGAGVIKVRAPGGGQRQVGFEDAALDFFEQAFAQPGLLCQLLLLPGVFGFEVVEHFVGVAVLQPGIRVGTVGLASDRGAGGCIREGHAGLSVKASIRKISVHAEPNTEARQAASGKSRYHKRLFTWLTTDVMTENDYLIAWSVYAFAALGCLLVWFLMTRWMWRYLKEPLLVAVAVLLFTPTMVDPAKDAMAPAVAITALDLMFKVGSNIWTAVSDLAMYGMFAFAAYLLFVLIRWPIERSRKARQPKPAAQPVETDPADEPFAEDDHYARKNAAPLAPTRAARVEPRL